MIDRPVFFRNLTAALAKQEGIQRYRPVNTTGHVDPVGAYGFAYDKICRDAIELLRTRRDIPWSERLNLTAGATERAIEIALRDAGTEVLRALCDYVDGKAVLGTETVPSVETPRELRDRIGRHVAKGELPGLMA